MKNWKCFAAGLALLSATTLCAQELPRLQQLKDGRTQFIVDGQPYIALAGELHNSTTGSVENMRTVWARMKAKNLNTVIAPVTWELLEPVEGQFDYTIIDSMIEGARKENLKLVVLWFGSWKNGTSTYIPAWVKKNPKKYLLAQNQRGEVMNTLSTLGTESAKADANAFAHLMRHIKEVDHDHTVIMMQVENEIGTLDMASTYMGLPNGCMRDYNAQANKAFSGQVPTQLTSYLKQHRKELNPAIRSAWEANGSKERGMWEEVFGKGTEDPDKELSEHFSYLTEEIFMAWNYATYVEQIAASGKEELALPMYVNAWMKQPTQPNPGQYPSGGPQAHLIDIWRAGAPSIDFLAPDIYAIDIFDQICTDYTQSGNPLFIPETRVDASGASRAFYTFGKYGALCYAPFVIDGGGMILSADPDEHYINDVYAMLQRLMPYMKEHIGTPRMAGLLLDTGRESDAVQMGNYTVSLRKMSTRAAQALVGVAVGEDNAQEEIASGVLVIQVADDEFIVAGGVGGVTVNISKGEQSKAEHVGLLSVDEICVDANGKEYLHRLNGDETSFGGGVIPAGQVKAFRIKMYTY